MCRFKVWILLLVVTCLCTQAHAKELLLSQHNTEADKGNDDEKQARTTNINYVNELEENIVSWTGAKIKSNKKFNQTTKQINTLSGTGTGIRRQTKSGLIIESNGIAGVDINLDSDNDEKSINLNTNKKRQRQQQQQQHGKKRNGRNGNRRKAQKETLRRLNSQVEPISGGGLFPSFFNVATRATISVNATCGQSGPEEYCKLVDAYPNKQLSVATQCSICNALSSDTAKQRPIESIISNTNLHGHWWQSPTLQNGRQYEYVTIVLDLKQIYQVLSVVLKAANSPRPAAWILEKSIDGINYEPWQYFGLNDADCMRRYNLPGENGKYVFKSDDEVICTTQFSKADPPENGEIHVFLWKNRPSSLKQPSAELLSFMTARFIRIRLEGMHSNVNLGNSVDWLLDTQSLEKRSFYSFQHIRVVARLDCHGHAEHMIEVAKKSGEGREVPAIESFLHCVCQHNTCGINCGHCCPMFNNKLFQNGTHTEAHTCEACNCNGHAENCIYDEFLARGICENCQNHTAGSSCEFCESGYFRLPEQVLTEPCQACDCQTQGSNGHCKSDSGECVCLDGFEGPRCEQCAAGYYGADCRKCECDMRGTIVDATCTGECKCKRFVTGKSCDTCLPGYFDLSLEHEHGCLPCWCSGVGTACVSSMLQTLTFETLNDWKITDINGKLIDMPTMDEETKYLFFNTEELSKVDQLYFQAPAGYLGNRLTSYGAHLEIKLSWYTIRGDTSGNPTMGPDIVLKGQNGMKVYFGQGNHASDSSTTINAALTEQHWLHLSDEASAVTRGEFLSVLSGLQTILVRATYHTDQIEIALEHAILYSGGNKLGGQTSSLVEQCVCPAGYTGLSCEGCEFGYLRVYENSTEQSNKCIPCPCNGHSNSCDLQSGGCGDCMHNTYGERCERCKMGFYGNPLHGTANDCKLCACPLLAESNNFSPSCQLKTHLNPIYGVNTANADYICTQCPTGYTGDHCEMCDEGYFGNPTQLGSRCEPCNCEGGPCDVFTGECIACKGNTEGWHCERCKLGYWGDPSMGCEPCDCYASGADSDVCDSNDGQCLCKPRFAGKKCDECDIGYAHIDLKCKPCNCNAYGCLNATYCDPDNGQCECKPGVVGLKCDQCAEGYFGLKEESNGCEECKCSTIGSISTVCEKRGGQCSCLANVTGRRCDKCKPGFWNLTQGLGCQNCRCDQYGSRSIECNPWTGQCDCKLGVGGQHCNECAEGYYGFSAEGCQRCSHCTNEGQICDSLSGRCICPNNTRGPSCTQCVSGTWNWQPRTGCRTCDCDPVGSIGQTCETSSGQCQCREGYDGRQCERCALGYFGYPECRRCNCHADGSFVRADGQIECDANGQCPCKALVVGLKCDTCMQATFGLSALNNEGCTRCFCFGRSLECEQSEWSWGHIRLLEARNLSVQYMRSQQSSSSDFEYIVVVQMAGRDSFQREDAEFGLMNDLNLVPGSAGNVSIGSYVNFNQPLYFQLPTQFLGDRTGSYGGYLYYNLLTENAHIPLDRRLLGKFPLAQIHAHKKLVLDFYEYEEEYEYSLNISYKIPLHESYWKEHNNNQQVDRALLMTALQNIKHIFLRGSPFADFTEVVLQNVHMDAAIFVYGSTNVLAKGVEKCKCPHKYDGLSCQDPGQGYYRWRNRTEIESTFIEDLIGRAVPCHCNGRSKDCERETGVCLNCQNNTGGDHCEQCGEGYYGEPNSALGCQPCPCPETSRNFAKGCSVFNNEVNCICKQGYMGALCNQCRPGYYGNPLAYANSTCQPCNCHSDGISREGCDGVTGQCYCKEGVTGLKCDKCIMEREFLNHNGCKVCDNCTLILLDYVELISGKLRRSMHHLDLTGVPPPYLKVQEYQNMYDALNTHFYDFNEARQLLMNFDYDALAKLYSHAENTKFQQRKALAIAGKRDSEAANMYKEADKLLVGMETLRSAILDIIADLNDYGKSEQHMSLPSALDEARYYLDTIRTHDQSVGNVRVATQCALPLFYEAGNASDAAFDAKGRVEKLWRLMNQTNFRYSDLRLQLDRTLDMQSEFDDVVEHVNNIRGHLLEDNGRINELWQHLEQQLNEDTAAQTTVLIDINMERQKDLVGKSEHLLTLCRTLEQLLNDSIDREVRKHWLPKAEKHAIRLEERFNEYARQFQPTRNGARIAMLASSAHKNISYAIDAAKQASLDAKERVTQAQNTLLVQDGKESVIQRAQESLRRSNELQKEALAQMERTKALENTLGVYENKVDRIKSTLFAAGVRTNNISTLLHDMLDESGSTRHLNIQSKEIAHQVNTDMKELQARNRKLKEKIEKLREKFAILEPDWEIKLGMAEENISLTKTNIRLANISLVHVEDQTIKEQDKFDKLNSTVGAQIQKLKDNIAKARHAAESIKVSVSSIGNKCIRTYLPCSYGLSTSNNIRLSFALPNRNGNSPLLYVEGTEGHYISLDLYKRHVRLIWNLGGTTAILTHPLEVQTRDPINDDAWYQIEANRTLNIGSLLVRRMNSYGSLVPAPVISGHTDAEHTRFLQTSKEHIYLGGYPMETSNPELQLSPGLNVVVHLVEVDHKPVGLWNFVSSSGKCGGAKMGAQESSSVSVARHFNGLGYAELRKARSRPYRKNLFALQMTFNTLDENALLFLAVDNKNNRSVSVTLNRGRIMFRIDYGEESKLEINTTQKYNTGKWVKIEAAREFVPKRGTENGMLRVNNERAITGSPTVPITSQMLPDLYDPVYYLAGVPPGFVSGSSKAPGADHPFLGCMMDVQVNGETYDPLESTAYYGVEASCKDMITKVGFAGNGYVELPSQSLRKRANAGFVFRSKQPDCLLLLSAYPPETKDDYDQKDIKGNYSFSLIDGRLQVWLNSGHSLLKLSSNVTINDGEFHVVQLIKTGRRFELWLDDSLQDSKILNSSPTMISMPRDAGGLYIGGSPELPEYMELAPTFIKLQGAMRDVVFNNKTINLNDALTFSHAQIGRNGPPMGSVNGMLDILLKTEPMIGKSFTTAPQGCNRVGSYSYEPHAFKFGDEAYSHALLQLSRRGFWQRNYEISFDFRTFYPNGLIFLAPGHKDKQKHYVALLLKDGQLTFVVRGRRREELKLTAKLNDGEWHHVTLKNRERTVTLSVLIGHTDQRTSVQMKMPKRIAASHQLIVGGLPELPPKLPGDLSTRLEPFKGCLKLLRFNNITQDLARPGKHLHVGQCFPHVERGSYFPGDAYAVYKRNFHVGKYLELEIDFRTAEMTGVLLSISEPTGFPALSLELYNGNLLFSCDLGDGNTFRVMSQLPTKYALCDNEWHNVSALYDFEQIALRVDNLPAVMGVARHQTLGKVQTKSPLYIGGIPDIAPSGTLMSRENFKGCIRHVSIRNERRDWIDMDELHNVLLSECLISHVNA